MILYLFRCGRMLRHMLMDQRHKLSSTHNHCHMCQTKGGTVGLGSLRQGSLLGHDLPGWKCSAPSCTIQQEHDRCGTTPDLKWKC